MPEYTESICQDGAAILKDGKMMTVDEILAELRMDGRVIKIDVAKIGEKKSLGIRAIALVDLLGKGNSVEFEDGIILRAIIV